MKYSVVLNTFDGGLNTKTDPALGTLNMSPDLQDVVFDDMGAVKTRNGYKKLNGTVMSTKPVLGLQSYTDVSNEKHLISVNNARLYDWDGSDFTQITGSTYASWYYVTSAVTSGIWTAGVAVNLIPHENDLFIADGHQDNMVYDGDILRYWGSPTPSAPIATEHSVAGSGLTGTYKYALQIVNTANVTGAMGSVSNELTVAGTFPINVSFLDIYDPANTPGGLSNQGFKKYYVQEKILCRTTAANSSVFWVVTSVSGGAASYVDKVNDTSLVNLADPDGLIGTPKFSTCVPFSGRMFGANEFGDNPSILYFSDIDSPERFPVDNLIKVGVGDGLKIVAVSVFQNGVMVSKDDGNGFGRMYMLYMPDTNILNWTLVKMDQAEPSQSKNVMIPYLNYMAYINRRGVFSVVDEGAGTIKARSISQLIEPDILQLAYQNLNRAAAISFKNKIWIAVPWGSTTDANNRVYQYDFIKGLGQEGDGAWSRFSNMGISCFTIHNGLLYGGSSSTGQVYEMDFGNNDDGTAIDSYYRTMMIKGMEEHTENQKVWRYVYLTVASSGAWDVLLEWSEDFYQDVNSSKSVDITPGGTSAVWGTSAWGNANWGTGTRIKRVKVVLNGMRSKAIQFRFSTETADQYFKIIEVKVGYNLRGER